MGHLLANFYLLLVTLPDHLYPFKNEVDGKLRRGIRSYKKAVAKAQRKYGPGHLGYKLSLYRETFHFAGSLLFIVLATLVSKDFLGSEMALYVLLYAAIAALTYQEFYVHPKRYGQHLKKGIVDWSFWVLPMLFFLFH